MSPFDTATSAMLTSLMSTFGQSVTHTSGAGVATALTGIVTYPDDPALYVSVEIPATVTPAKGDTVRIGTTDYAVFHPEKGIIGDGGTVRSWKLALEKK